MCRCRLARFEPLVAASLIAVLASPSISAQTSSAAAAYTGHEDTPSEDLLNDRFVITIGAFIVTSNVNGSLSGSANTSDQKVDFDKEFGTDTDQTRWRADVLWRITPRQQVRFSYFNDDVQRTRPIDQDLAWGDYTFLAGGEVNAQTNFRVYELDYQFAFLRRPNYEIVAVAGLHVDDLTLKLSGNASLSVDTPTGPAQETATFSTKSNSLTAPLPVLGLRGNWAVSPHVCLDAAAELFALSYQGISGNWSELSAGAAWMFNDHFGVGLDYDRFETHADLSRLNFSGRLNFGYQGLLLSVRGGF
jgi:hypothetical protein